MLPGVDHHGLVRFVTRMVGPQDAEDVVQTAYLKVLGTQFPHSGSAAFKTWVFAVAKHAAVDHLRASSDEPLELGDRRVVAPEATSLERDAEALLDKMSPETSASWRIYAAHGLAGAAVCGVSRRTFCRRVARARLILRKGLS